MRYCWNWLLKVKSRLRIALAFKVQTFTLECMEIFKCFKKFYNFFFNPIFLITHFYLTFMLFVCLGQILPSIFEARIDFPEMLCTSSLSMTMKLLKPFQSQTSSRTGKKYYRNKMNKSGAASNRVTTTKSICAMLRLLTFNNNIILIIWELQ